jgi:hypothetical protein
MVYGSKQASTTFTGAVGTMPSTTTAPIPGGQCYRSQNAYTGTFMPGAWGINIEFQASVAAGANVAVNTAIWVSPDPTGKTNATQLFGLGEGELLMTTSVPTANLQVGVSQPTIVGLLDSAVNNYTAPIILSNAYIFLQIACEITSAGSGATSDAMICTSPNSLIYFPPFVQNQSKLYYFNDHPVGSKYGLLSDSIVPASETATGTGWTVGTVATGNYAMLQYASKLATTSLNTTAQPAGTPNGSDCWATNNALTGTFAAGDWIISPWVCSVTTDGAKVQLWVRIWRSQHPDGTAATEITSGPVATTSTVGGPQPTIVAGTFSEYYVTLGKLSEHSQAPCIADITLPAITLLKEYLFLQIAVETLGSGGGANADAVIITAAESFFATPPFTAGSLGANTIGGSFPGH